MLDPINRIVLNSQQKKLKNNKWSLEEQSSVSQLKITKILVLKQTVFTNTKINISQKIKEPRIKKLKIVRPIQCDVKILQRRL